MAVACPQCGHCLSAAQPDAVTKTPTTAASADSEQRIAELESQVRILSDKASQAADKLADYEDELHDLKTQSLERASTPTPNQSRLSTFLSLRGVRTPPSPPPDPSTLLQTLKAERQLRIAAEEKLNAVTSELEELSASLFQSANEMVAEERRARSRLEERIRALEEREKKGNERLESLERAFERVIRARGVLRSAPSTPMTATFATQTLPADFPSEKPKSEDAKADVSSDEEKTDVPEILTTAPSSPTTAEAPRLEPSPAITESKPATSPPESTSSTIDKDKPLPSSPKIPMHVASAEVMALSMQLK